LRALPNATAHDALHARFFIFQELLQPSSTMEQFQRNMIMNVNIPPRTTPPHHQTKAGKRKKSLNKKTPKGQ